MTSILGVFIPVSLQNKNPETEKKENEPLKENDLGYDSLENGCCKGLEELNLSD